jgi:hypothetical protein
VSVSTRFVMSGDAFFSTERIRELKSINTTFKLNFEQNNITVMMDGTV